MPKSSIETVTIIDNAEPILRTVAKIILYVGLFGAIICIFTICTIRTPSIYSSSQTVINPIGVGVTIATALFSIMSWALCNVVANISSKLSVISSHFEDEESAPFETAEK